MTLYDQLNQLHRAIDIYNFPQGIPLIKQLQNIRVLYNGQSRRRSCRYLPTISELHDRLANLAYEIYSQQNEQLSHELIDTALEIGATLPAFEQERNLLRQYERITTPTRSENIYSLKSISEDRQNVHHTSINEHVKQMVRNIIKDYPPQDHYWTTGTAKLQKCTYWKKTNFETLIFIHENPSTFTIGITLKQLANSIFRYIQSQSEEHQDQLYQRFNEELDDMRGKCSTGHLSRLINIVQGFSEKYTIQIDPEKEIKSFIYFHLNKVLQDAPDEVQEGIVEHTKLFQDYLSDEKYQTYFEDRFGKQHSKYIRESIQHFINGTA